MGKSGIEIGIESQLGIGVILRLGLGEVSHRLMNDEIYPDTFGRGKCPLLGIWNITLCCFVSVGDD